MRDYANRSRRSSPPRRNGLLVVSIFMIALALALPFALFYLHHKKMLITKDLSQNKNDEKTAVLDKPKDPSQQFDFYTLLPKMAVPNNASDEKPS